MEPASLKLKSFSKKLDSVFPNKKSNAIPEPEEKENVASFAANI